MKKYLIYSSNSLGGVLLLGLDKIIENNNLIKMHFNENGEDMFFKNATLTGFAKYLFIHPYHRSDEKQEYYSIESYTPNKVTIINKSFKEPEEIVLENIWLFVDKDNKNPAIIEFEDDTAAELWAEVEGMNKYYEEEN